jgi:hypothetical protein
MEQTTIILISAVGLMIAGAGAAGAMMLVRLLKSPQPQEASVDWLNRFSLNRYRTMERVLSEADFEFLKAQKGYQPEIGRRLREARCEVFRSYLGCLRRDYRRLEAVLLLLMISAPQDRPESAKGLLRRRLMFEYALVAARWRAFLFRYGFEGARVDVSPLVDALSSLRLELGQLALARQAAL